MLPSPICLVRVGRHSDSFDESKYRCSRCKERFERVGRVNRDGTPAKPRAATPFALFVKENFATVKAANPATPHKDVMKLLSSAWKERKAATPAPPAPAAAAASTPSAGARTAGASAVSDHALSQSQSETSESEAVAVAASAADQDIDIDTALSLATAIDNLPVHKLSFDDAADEDFA